MNILIKGALLLPMTKENYTIQADVAIRDGKILAIDNIPSSFVADRTIDAAGMLMLPSFINAHTHLSMGLMRNYKDNCENLQEWLGEIFPIEDKLQAEDIYTASLLGICELIKSGCTLFSDMYFFQTSTLRAAREAGIRAIVGQTFFGDGKETERRIREVYPEIREYIGDDDRYRIDMAPHAIYTCTGETYVKAREYAEKYGSHVNTHLSETAKEVDDCYGENGLSPLFYLNSIGALTRNMYLAHGVHLTEEELRLVARKGMSVVHNPSSNAKLASGTLSLARCKELGVNVALGTDGASSNNNLDMLEEMHVAALIATTENGRPSKVSAYDIISMATINGARALGVDDRLGSLEEGKDADLILIDTNSANLTPLNDPFSAVVYSASSENIDTVICKGEILMEGRQLATLDERKICRDARRVWEDLRSRR